MAGPFALFSRIKIDTYILLLLGTVGLAALIPARGQGKIVVDHGVEIAVMLLFFLYGARLTAKSIWAGLTHYRLQSLVLASTYILFPILGIGLAAILGKGGILPPDIAAGILFLCVLPSTVQSSIAFTSIARGDIPAALCAATVSNLIGVIATPLLVALLLPRTSGGFSTSAVESIVFQILLPFIVGQVARPLVGGWIGRHKFLTTIVDRGAILLVVYAAFSEGMVRGIWSQLSIADLVVLILVNAVLLAIVMVATTWVSRRLHFSTEEEIAIVFCGSKKSMASGIPMATILFPAQSVSLIVLPLMLFHQLQLFVCASMARRYAARTATPPPPAAGALAGDPA